MNFYVGFKLFISNLKIKKFKIDLGILYSEFRVSNVNLEIIQPYRLRFAFRLKDFTSYKFVNNVNFFKVNNISLSINLHEIYPHGIYASSSLEMSKEDTTRLLESKKARALK